MAARKAKFLTEEHKRHISDAHKGKKKPWVISPMKGKKWTLEYRQKVLNARIGFKHSLESRRKMSLAQKGEKGPGWKGGISNKNDRIRQSLEYKLWRTAVFERDRYTCIWCGRKGQLQADHIKAFAFFPELRFAIDNGRTLCIPCHKTTPTYLKNRPPKLY